LVLPRGSIPYGYLCNPKPLNSLKIQINPDYMKKLFILSILFSILFVSCNDDPEPEPEVIRAYVYLYHFIPEHGSVIWEVDESALPEEQLYATQFSGAVVLESASEEISFTVRHSGTNEVLVSQLVQLEQDKYYNVIVRGSSEDPALLIREIDTSHPDAGQVKFQVLHSIAGQGPIDVYMGGNTVDNRGLSELPYLSLSTPFEVKDYDARAAILVSAHSEPFNQDSVLLTSIYNDEIATDANYLSVVAPPTYNTADTLLTFWLYELPLD
jgi:hypothetical protein